MYKRQQCITPDYNYNLTQRNGNSYLSAGAAHVNGIEKQQVPTAGWKRAKRIGNQQVFESARCGS